MVRIQLSERILANGPIRTALSRKKPRVQKEELIKAWKAWDEAPSSEFTATRLENVCNQVADHFNISSTVLREYVATLRRSGRSCDEAVNDLFEHFEV